MESRIEVHKCLICGRDCVLTLVSIGTTHQWVAQVICPECVTEEHLRRVGRHPARVVEREDKEQAD
ncbi:MAG: hypothetical protein ACE5NP_13710 [Anaerolineae bacterium]